MKKDTQAVEETAVVVADDSNFLVIKDGDDFSEIIEANLQGEPISPRMLDRIKVPAGGATTWQVPGPDGEVPMQEIEGVIVHMQTIRTYWESDYTGAGTPPDCFSQDGKIGVGTPGGSCFNCPMNKFGEKGGKPCAEKIMLFFMTENSYLPTLLLVPPASLKPTKEYLTNLIKYHKAKKHRAVTGISLDTDRNNNGMVFSKVKYRFVDHVKNPEAWDAIAEKLAGLVSGISEVELQRAADENGADAQADAA